MPDYLHMRSLTAENAAIAEDLNNKPLRSLRPLRWNFYNHLISPSAR
jgi:hypothetical protein